MVRSSFLEWMVSLSCAQFPSVWWFCSNSFLTPHSAVWRRRCLPRSPFCHWLGDWWEESQNVWRGNSQFCQGGCPCLLLPASVFSLGPSHSFSDSSYCWIGWKKCHQRRLRTHDKRSWKILAVSPQKTLYYLVQKISYKWTKTVSRSVRAQGTTPTGSFILNSPGRTKEPNEAGLFVWANLFVFFKNRKRRHFLSTNHI